MSRGSLSEGEGSCASSCFSSSSSGFKTPTSCEASFTTAAPRQQHCSMPSVSRIKMVGISRHQRMGWAVVPLNERMSWWLSQALKAFSKCPGMTGRRHCLPWTAGTAILQMKKFPSFQLHRMETWKLCTSGQPSGNGAHGVAALHVAGIQACKLWPPAGETRLRLGQTKLGGGAGHFEMKMGVFTVGVNLRDPNRQKMRNFQRKVGG